MKILFVFEDINVEHLGVMYMSSMLKENGHETDIVYADYPAIESRLKEEDGPVILAYSTHAFYNEHFVRLSEDIKKYFNVFSVFGGQYPTANPDMIMRPGVDSVCIGEGEYTLLELADRLDKGADISDIEGLWLKKSGEIIKNRLRPLIEDPDRLLFPDRNLFREKAPFFQERISVITSRGCFFDCPYCYNSTLKRLYKDNKYRRRSVDNVVAEVLAVKELQTVKFILFHDDIFTHPVSWLEEFAVKFKAQCRVPFSCYVRIDMVTEKIIDLLKEAGCYSISFGVESADEFLRKSTYKRSMEKKMMIDTSRMLKKSGIRVRTTNIIGAPESSVKADIETARLNVRCGVDLAKVGILAGYPSTEISDQMTESGIWAVYYKIKTPFFIRMLKMVSPNIVRRFERLMLSVKGPQYSNKTEMEKRMTANLIVLFPVAVGFPVLLPFLYWLIKFPVNIFFVLSGYVWDNYCTYLRIYNTGVFGFFRGFIKRKRSI
ncbi:B12-binding domain-containing radical SAM protein [Elusimicrobiota bacterium]